MSLFKRMLSSIGIGSAKVDTVLEGEEFEPGAIINGVVKIKGGSTEQHIDGLYFAVHTSYKVTVEREMDAEEEEGEPTIVEEEITKTTTLHSFKLADAFSIGSGEEKEIEISLQLPWSTPLTHGNSKTWISTGLDIKKGLDAGDKDYIRVVPGQLALAVVESMEQLGFRLVESECEEASASLRRNHPVIQEFEFKPASGSFHGRLDEVEIIFAPNEDGLEIYMEVDRKARGLASLMAEMAGLDESRQHVFITDEDLPDLTDKLNEIIESHA